MLIDSSDGPKSIYSPTSTRKLKNRQWIGRSRPKILPNELTPYTRPNDRVDRSNVQRTGSNWSPLATCQIMQPLSGYVLSVFIIEYADHGKVHRHYPLTSGIIFLMTSRYHVDPHDRSLDIVFLCLLVFLSAPPSPFRLLGFPFSRQNWRKRRVMSIPALVLWYFFWGEKENKIDPPLGSKVTGERKLSVLRQIRIGSWYELNVFSNVHRIEEKSTLVRKSSADSLVYFEHKPETECLRLLNLDRLTLNRVHLFSAKLRESLRSWKTISAVTGFCFWGIRIKK